MAVWATGIDLGAQRCRAVVLQQKSGQWNLKRSHTVETKDEAGDIRPVVEILTELSKIVKPKGAVHIVDSGMSVMVRYIESLPLAPENLQRYVRMDLRQHAADDGNLAADFHVLPIDGDDLKIVCALAQADQVDVLQENAKEAGLSSASFGLSAFALYNALLADRLPRTLDESEVCLAVDIGEQGTRIALARDGDLLACRVLSMGGAAFTEALMKPGEDPEIAERRKIDAALEKQSLGTAKTSVVDMAPQDLFKDARTALNEQYPDDSSFAVDNDLSFLDDQDEIAVAEGLEVESSNNGQTDILSFADAAGPGARTQIMGNAQMGPELRRVAEQLFMQLNSSVNWLRSQIGMPRLEVNRVLLSGGSAQLAGLRVYLAQRFNLPIDIARVSPALTYLDEEDDDSGSAISASTDVDADLLIAVGAALSGQTKSQNKNYPFLDMRTEFAQRAQAWRQELLWPRVAAGLIAAAAILSSVTSCLETSSLEENLALYKADEKKYKNLEKDLKAQQTYRDELQEDLGGIASRLFAARDLLNTVRVFKEEANRSKDLWVTSLVTSGLNAADDDNHGDTAIERGSIIVTGQVKPDLGNTPGQRLQIFEQWFERVVAAEDTNGKPLFRDQRVNFVKNEADREAGDNNDVNRFSLGELIFEVEFFLNPTQVSEVTLDDIVEGGE